MQIAITSQNRKTITEHAGKCRNFWIYYLDQGKVASKELIELAIDQSLHASHHELADPLLAINVLITRSMGSGLYHRLKQQGILPIVTTEESPEEAIAAFLENRLEVRALNTMHSCEDHHHHH
jgi:predicted Fe-Mo cluster-binding NifX family protein